MWGTGVVYFRAMKGRRYTIVGVGLVCLGLAAGTGLAQRLSGPRSLPLAGRELAAGVGHGRGPGAAAAASLSYQEQNLAIGRYCFRCHNDMQRVGGLSLESYDAAAAYERS